MIIKSSYKTVRALAAASVGIAGFLVVLNTTMNPPWGANPVDSGTRLGIIAIALIGVIASVIADCLRDVCEKLDRLAEESIKKDNQ